MEEHQLLSKPFFRRLGSFAAIGIAPTDPRIFQRQNRDDDPRTLRHHERDLRCDEGEKPRFAVPRTCRSRRESGRRWWRSSTRLGVLKDQPRRNCRQALWVRRPTR